MSRQGIRTIPGIFCRKLEFGDRISMKYAGIVVSELFQNYRRLIRLVLYERKARHGGTFLGTIWNLLNPALQIFVYWFVFTVGLKMQTVKGDYPYVLWLMTGLLPWMYLNSAMMAGTGSYFVFSGILKNIRFPLSVVPEKSVVSAMMDHLWTMGILMGVLFFSGVRPRWVMLEIFYYMLGSVFFLTAFSLMASAVCVIVRDFQKIVSPCLRLMFYISSVVWPIENLSRQLQMVLRLNPLTYIIEGYRNCLLYQRGFLEDWERGICFWSISLLLFLGACQVHGHLRERFIDMI